jgi:hypothetical protein
MINNLTAPPESPEWFKLHIRDLNRSLNSIVNQSQGKTNPTQNIQEFSVTVQANTNASGAISPISIQNKLPVQARVVTLGGITRTDGTAITTTPQIIWEQYGTEIIIKSIGGLANSAAYSLTFNINI